ISIGGKEQRRQNDGSHSGGRFRVGDGPRTGAYESRFAEGDPRQNHVRASGGHESGGPWMGRYGRRDGAAVGKGHGRRQGVRLQAVVQRHLRPNRDGLALRVRTGIAAAAGALTATAAFASAAGISTLVDLMGEFYAESGFPLDRLWATNSFSVLLNDPSLGSAWLLFDDREAAGYAVLTVRFSIEHGGRDAFVD